jgi:hypothetical protein
MGQMDGIWNIFGEFVIWGKVQRRGVDVSPPEIGSRDGVLCIGGISKIYAELRRELGRGNLRWGFFGGLGGFPREGVRRGDT